ncbi:hypothetical protein BUALT_Bualt04G0143000 [Buddleja alternifolia]|uniref:Uncharacterized protein n=3 Tax=Pentapetalae TaxID=1437201 RepID=A0AAV6XQA7_9LAMI|nr:hypothetical protein BUALT_Bualt04G0143000 [Buddleja alternifolia]
MSRKLIDKQEAAKKAAAAARKQGVAGSTQSRRSFIRITKPDDPQIESSSTLQSLLASSSHHNPDTPEPGVTDFVSALPAQLSDGDLHPLGNDADMLEAMDKLESLRLQDYMQSNIVDRPPPQPNATSIQPEWRIYEDSSVLGAEGSSTTLEMMSHILLPRDKLAMLNHSHPWVEKHAFALLSKLALCIHQLTLNSAHKEHADLVVFCNFESACVDYRVDYNNQDQSRHCFSMGRSPCCDKIGLKKGPWTPEEDQKLLAYIEEHGHGSWRALPAKAGLQRCGKSCRLRWTNYLRPDIKRGKFSLQEEQTIIQLHALLGNRWSAIATHLPKRTDNEIKNYWNTHLKKRLAKMGIDPVTHKPKNDTLLSSDGHSKNVANLSHMAQWESARLEAEARLVRQSKLRSGSATSFQTQSSKFTSASSPIQKPVGPTRCLDVLKAWSGGVWGKTSDAAGTSGGVSVMGSGGELESPTSTLSSAAGVGGDNSSAAFVEFAGNSSASCDDGIMKEENEAEWKNLPEYRDGIGNPIPFPSGTQEKTPFPSAWAPESAEHVPSGNFVEKFTDLLLSTSADDRRDFSEDGGESDSGDGSAGGEGGCSDYYEDNKNYWNSILSLVNSSPSDSPMF